MSGPLVLRDYQQQALSDLWNWFSENDGNPLIELPTGAGKSLVIAEWCKLVFDTDPSARVLVLAHVRELIAQNYAEMMGLWPEAPAGIYSAGLNRRDLRARLLFASIQSIHRRAYDLQQVDMVLVDEAHLIPRKNTTMYKRFLDDLKTINPHMKIIGLTATPFRIDSGLLHEGDDAMFDAICHRTSPALLIEQGYLCPPISYRQQAQIDTTGIGTRGGEFIASQLEAEALDPETVTAIVDRICEAGADRKSWLIFGCTVKHCEVLSEALNERGFEGTGVYGDTPKADRARIIEDFKAGRLRFLCSQGVLTTGFNAKSVDMIALARPTKSTGLYVQMVGRGTRLSPETGKEDCLVLDFGGNITRHGPFDDPFIPTKKRKGEGSAPYKECPECQCACATMTRHCPACGFEFPPPERVVNVVPDQKPILSQEPEWLDISAVSYRAHVKEGKPTSLCVTYQIGLSFQREWVCLEHSGYARTKAESWWLRRAPAPVPRNVQEALDRQHEIAAPSHLRTRKTGKYDEIIGFKFAPIVRGEAA